MEPNLLDLFKDPSTIHDLPTTQLLWASLITTILGMGITFVVLVVLQFIIGLFDKISGVEKPQPKPEKATAPAVKKADVEPAPQTDDELVPAITAALAMMLETPASRIVVSNIRRIEDRAPAWSKAGLAEQMQNNL